MTTNFQNIPIYDSLEKKVGHEKVENFGTPTCLEGKERKNWKLKLWDSRRFYKIFSFNFNDKCLVYLLTCNCCKKQYVGQTVDEFRLRWNHCKSNCRKHQRGCMQQHLYKHFCSSNHNCFISDVSVTFIDKTNPSDPLKREDYWRSNLKTMAQFGLNVEQSVWRSLFLVSLLSYTSSGKVGR